MHVGSKPQGPLWPTSDKRQITRLLVFRSALGERCVRHRLVADAASRRAARKRSDCKSRSVTSDLALQQPQFWATSDALSLVAELPGLLRE